MNIFYYFYIYWAEKKKVEYEGPPTLPLVPDNKRASKSGVAQFTAQDDAASAGAAIYQRWI